MVFQIQLSGYKMFRVKRKAHPTERFPKGRGIR